MLCSRLTIHVHNFNKHFDRKLKGKGLNKVAVLFDQNQAKKDSSLAEIHVLPGCILISAGTFYSIGCNYM